MSRPVRIERDGLGELPVPAAALHGIHTERAIANFPLAGRPVDRGLVRAYGAVKLACLQVNRALGHIGDDMGEPLERACREMIDGRLDAAVVVDALQGGAGTSTNMNVNEALANRALGLLGLPPGSYDRIDPLAHVNLHQSTNDTFPTALRLAAIAGCRRLETAVTGLMEAFQGRERAFSGVVKVGRTEFQDAVLITLGREMGAYADALSRDRWRIRNCEERLRVVNLGGTAIGTGLSAPRDYIFRVVDQLRAVTGIGFARAENLVEATQNADALVETAGILSALSVTLFKASNDLRLLSSGPEAGFGELRLPPRQAGSSLMPGKVNPVIPEAVMQACLSANACQSLVTQAAALGTLELNPFLPLLADGLLTMIGLLERAAAVLASHCVCGIEADETRCRRGVESSTAAASALVSELGYAAVERAVLEARGSGRGLKETLARLGLMDEAAFDRATDPAMVNRLGSRTGGE